MTGDGTRERPTVTSRSDGARDIRALAIVLAGGQGRRLLPLTRDRAKPAVPFGGQYRLIDFVLSNLVNAGFRRIVVLTQYKSHSLDRHLARSWALSALTGEYVAAVPAQMRKGPRWFAGSADAIYQNLELIEDESPDHVIVMSADHVYRMDCRQFLRHHLATGAQLTVAGIPVPIEQARGFGILETDTDGRVSGFAEKPARAVPLPDRPALALASMGNYIFTVDALREAVTTDADRSDSNHDIGGDIVPMLVGRDRAFFFDFAAASVPGQPLVERGYWQDVGTIDAYYSANMDLLPPAPAFELRNDKWPILTSHRPHPPARFVCDEASPQAVIVDSLVSSGAVIAGSAVRRSIVAPAVRIHAGATIEASVLFDGVEIGAGAIVRRAILDKNVRIAPGARVGVDEAADRARFPVSSGGVVVIGKGARVDAA